MSGNGPCPSTSRLPVDDEIAVRDARVADAPSIAVVHVDSFHAAYAGLLSRETLGRLDVDARTQIWAGRIADAGESGRRVTVIEYYGRVVGFAYFGSSTDEDEVPGRIGHVYSVHTEPTLTGRGIGTALMTHATKAMTVAGFSAATLWVVAENTRARGFYEGLSWRFDDVGRTEVLGIEGEPGANCEVETVRYRIRLGAMS